MLKYATDRGERLSLIFDYGLDSLPRALLILLLSFTDRQNEKGMGRLYFQKATRYFEYLREKREIDFSNYIYGGVSYELQENMETLEECGLVTTVGRGRNIKYILTEEGEQASKELIKRFNEEMIRKLKFAKSQLNDLTISELLFFMYMLLPETRVKSIEFEKLYAKKEELTHSLFKKGRISTHTASKWLGVDEKTFLDSL